MILFRCFFCSNTNKNSEKIICHKCIQKFSDYKFYCCPRCSKVMCSGCENLSAFQIIFCLYSYNSIFSKIIVNAKDKTNYIFQKIFYDILYENIFNTLEEILLYKDYDAVFLAPYKKSRLFHGYWHPNLFFEKILHEIKKKFLLKYRIFVPHYTSKSSHKIFLKEGLNLTKNSYYYLLCDDVLTSGHSALNAHKTINCYLLNICEDLSIKSDLFSIFRSPQK